MVAIIEELFVVHSVVGMCNYINNRHHLGIEWSFDLPNGYLRHVVNGYHMSY